MTPLRAHRKAKGLTLNDIATVVGVSESQLSRIERDGTDSLGIALKLAEITGADPALFGREAAGVASASAA